MSVNDMNGLPRREAIEGKSLTENILSKRMGKHSHDRIRTGVRRWHEFRRMRQEKRPEAG
jgi:hypothetical protein